MDIVLHLGAHATDRGAIGDWLAHSTPKLEEDGVRLVAPTAFRPALNEALQTLRGSPAPRALEAELLDRLCGGACPDRIVLSHSWLLGPAGRILESRGVYPVVGTRVVALCNLFPSHRIELALGVRAPGPFLSAVLALQDDIEPAEFWSRAATHPLDWAKVAERLRDHAPQARLTLWRHEDLADHWPGVGAALLGPDARLPVPGFPAVLRGVVSPEGLARLDEYLAATRIETAEQALRLARIFATRFPAPPADSPDPDALIADGTVAGAFRASLAEAEARYAGLGAAVADLPGVTLLGPESKDPASN